MRELPTQEIAGKGNDTCRVLCPLNQHVLSPFPLLPAFVSQVPHTEENLADSLRKIYWNARNMLSREMTYYEWVRLWLFILPFTMLKAGGAVFPAIYRVTRTWKILEKTSNYPRSNFLKEKLHFLSIYYMPHTFRWYWIERGVVMSIYFFNWEIIHTP